MGNNMLTKYEEIFEKYKENNLSNYAFPLFLFTKRLYNDLQKRNCKDVLFMSREGQFLKKLFEKYCEIRKELSLPVCEIKTHYFYGSRNSVFTASMKKLDKEDFDSLFRFFNYFMTARKFLFSIGFSNDQIEKVKETFGEKIDKRCFSFKNSKIFTELKNNKQFKAIYENNRESQSKAFGLYMQSFNIDFKNEDICFVDIGYHGTMQDLVFKFYDEKIKIYGYFIKSRAKQFKDNIKIGLLGDKNDKSVFGSQITKYDAFNYEQILRADHGRCLGYQINDNITSSPIIDNSYGDKDTYDKYVKTIQSQIYDKFVLIANQSLKEKDDIEKICILYYYLTIKSKTDLDYKWLLDMEDNHHDDFGYVGYPGKAFARKLRKFVFKSKDKIFVLKNKHYIKKLNKELNNTTY